MVNSSSSKIIGIGTVELRFTSGNTVTLKEVLHVPDVKKNFLSVLLLIKDNFKLALESDKFEFTKNHKFIDSGCATFGLFKCNVINEIANKQILFKDYVTGFPKETSMILNKGTIQLKVTEGSKAVLVKNLYYLSCDPYMRNQMERERQY